MDWKEAIDIGGLRPLDEIGSLASVFENGVDPSAPPPNGIMSLGPITIHGTWEPTASVDWASGPDRTVTCVFDPGWAAHLSTQTQEGHAEVDRREATWQA